MKKALIQFGLYGFLIWLIPFLVSSIIFSYKESYVFLFEKIITISLIVMVSILSFRVFRKPVNNSIFVGILLGFSWTFISLFFDLFMFLGPFGYSLNRYLSEIPLVYVNIIIITVLSGYLNQFLGNYKEEVGGE